MEVAGFGYDAFVARVAAWVPMWMAAFAHALARILATGMFDVIAMGDGDGKQRVFGR